MTRLPEKGKMYQDQNKSILIIGGEEIIKGLYLNQEKTGCILDRLNILFHVPDILHRERHSESPDLV